MKYYVYSHSNAKYGIFYVGKGCGNRLRTTGNRSDFWKRIASKHGYHASVLCNCLTEQEAYDKEIFFIAYLKAKGECVANFSSGGDGVRVDKRWWGAKISESLKGMSRPRGQHSSSYKDFASYEELHTAYVVEGLSVIGLAGRYKVSTTTVWTRLKQLGIPIRDIKARGRGIVCTTDGSIFPSITTAARSYGLHRENIRKVLSGKYKTTGNLHFEYVGE